MMLRDPISFTYILITILIFVIGGETFSVFSNRHERDCWRSNAELLQAEQFGPLKQCSNEERSIS